MKKNYPGFPDLFKQGLALVIFMLLIFNGFGQTISKPIVSQVPVCKGSEIIVTFDAINGNSGNVNAGQWFTSLSEYEISINNGSTESWRLATVPHGNIEKGKNESVRFNITVQIPDIDLYQPGASYSVQIISTNPDLTSEFSNVFTVKAKPLPPTASNNGPLCTGTDLQLTASNISGATYNWTGPDGYTATGRTPIRTNVTSAMAGTYTVTATVNGCTGNPVSTNVIINPIPPSPIVTNNGPVCVGFTLNLFASTVDGATYSWTGPNGFTSNSQNPQVSTNSSLAMAGTYTVKATVNSCTSIDASTNVIITSMLAWTGLEDSNWNNISNWNCNSLPTLETDVLIPENPESGYFPVINTGANAFTKDLIIENGTSVLVNSNWLRIAGVVNNSGILNVETGSVSFEGTSAQIIPADAFQNNSIQNLRINNSSGVTSEATIELTGILKVQSGNFNTGDNLSLISNAIQTALIDGESNGEVIGLVKMQRYLDVAFGYKYFSSPFQSSVIDDFAPFMDFTDPNTGFPHAYRYNENRNIEINAIPEDATGWEVHTGNLNVAEGYALNFGNTNEPVLVELTGEVNNGPIASKTLLNNHRKYTKGSHLVGNPYPSPIDWNAGNGWTKNNLDNAIYFFTASDSDQYTGSYTAYVNEVSTEEPLVDGRSSSIIPSMQGFFIKVSDSETEDLVSGTFGMDNRVRVNDFNQEFLKTPERDPKQLLRLTASYKGGIKNDAMVIYFTPYSTLNFEKEFDAHKLMNSDPDIPNLYNISKDKKELAINAIPYPDPGNYNKIPLGIKVEKSGTMSISLNSIENLSSVFNIYLIDHFRNIGQNLSKKPEYIFNIKEGLHNDRFELMFSEEKITNPAIAFNEPFHVEVENNEVVVKLNLEDNQKGILQASTMTGQILQTKKGSGKEKVVLNGITSNGVYIINLVLGEAQYSKKVLIQK